MIHEHDSVVLTVDLPTVGLVAGDIGVVVHIYSNQKAYEVEFIALDGSTITVETLEPDQVRPIKVHEIPHVREWAAA